MGKMVTLVRVSVSECLAAPGNTVTVLSSLDGQQKRGESVNRRVGLREKLRGR